MWSYVLKLSSTYSKTTKSNISNARWAEKVTPVYYEKNILKFDDMINLK